MYKRNITPQLLRKKMSCRRCGYKFKLGDPFYRTNSCSNVYCEKCIDILYIELPNTEPETITYDFVTPEGRTIEIREVI